MSNQSEWTLGTLYKHIREVIDGVRLEYRQQFKSMDKANKLALAGQKILDQKNNEFRTQLDRQADTFATKADVDSRLSSMTDIIDANKQLSEERRDTFDKQIAAITLSVSDRVTRVEHSALLDQIAAIRLELKDVVTKKDLEITLTAMRSQIDSLDANRNVIQGQSQQRVQSTNNAQWIIQLVLGIPFLFLAIVEAARLIAGR